MLTPFQRLLYHGNQTRRVLLAASGPYLRTLDSVSGQLLSKWSHLESETRNGTPEINENNDLPRKRQKLADKDDSGSESAEIVIENGSGKKKSKANGFTVPCITHLCGTSDGKHVVVVTGEDKAVRVLSMSENGILRQLSQRIMPKRPSSIILTPAQDTILCADKFGDVYSMPLLGNTGDNAQSKTSMDEETNGTTEELMQPSATTKTVHSKRNLRALEAQQKQKKVKKEKSELSFEHDLLLGHVSLLTDIACIKIKASSGKDRTYILSADRDEHIRVSRGIPQAHIIETFCLGHEQFISKIHIPAWKPEILISGGGDDYLLVWDWQSGIIKQKVELKAFHEKLRPVIDKLTPRNFAVSGIWSIQQLEQGEYKQEGQIIVAFEGVPGLVFLRLKENGNIDLNLSRVDGIEHNVLDVAVLEDQQFIVVSLDNTHKPWTTDVPMDGTPGDAVIPWRFLIPGQWSNTEMSIAKSLNEVARTSTDSLSESLRPGAMNSMFYNVENLRKRLGPEGGEQEDEP